MSKNHLLQDPFLNALRKEKIPVSVFWLTASNYMVSLIPSISML